MMVRWTENTFETWMLGVPGYTTAWAPAVWGGAEGNPVQPHLGTSGHRRADRSKENQNLQGRNQTSRSPKKRIPLTKVMLRREGAVGSYSLSSALGLPPPPTLAQSAHTRVKCAQSVELLSPNRSLWKGLEGGGYKNKAALMSEGLPWRADIFKCYQGWPQGAKTVMHNPFLFLEQNQGGSWGEKIS